MFRVPWTDESTREAKLRLDTLEGALADLAGVRAVVPGKPMKVSFCIALSQRTQTK